jgi:hypothetical protein
MITNLQGRLRNTKLPKTHGLFPLFEAVVNSIHSIEELTDDMNLGSIKVEIVRDPQEPLELEDADNRRGPDAVGNIIGFKIHDNGAGFNDSNMESFETLDSDHKIEKGCRGVGRLLWLKAFDAISVQSTYFNNGRGYIRKFIFNSLDGVTALETSDLDSIPKNSTTVFLKDFKDGYRNYSRKTTEAIAKALFEHCLWYFIRDGGAPRIIVTDNDETIDLHNIYDDHMVASAEKQTITVGGYDFELTHVKLLNTISSTHNLAYCAASRLVREETINIIGTRKNCHIFHKNRHFRPLEA